MITESPGEAEELYSEKHMIYTAHQIQEDMMSEKCRICGINEKCLKYFSWKT
jgi:hypothetical protein